MSTLQGKEERRATLRVKVHVTSAKLSADIHSIDLKSYPVTAMNVSFFKFFAATLIFVLNVVATFLQMVMPSSGWISYAEALAGGVFIGASLAHLIPESLHSFHGITELPVAPIISMVCFLLLVVVEMFASSHGEHGDEGEKLLKGKNKPRQKSAESSPSPALRVSKVESATLVLYWILVFHCVVEGIAFGAMKGESVVLAMFFAIIGHKPVETFALALKLWKEIHGAKYFIMMGAFSAVAPLTILGVAALGNQSKLFFAVVAAASAGAFLFAGCHELGEMLHHGHKWSATSKLQHIVAFTIGMGWMAAISLFAGEHEH